MRNDNQNPNFWGEVFPAIRSAKARTVVYERSSELHGLYARFILNNVNSEELGRVVARPLQPNGQRQRRNEGNSTVDEVTPNTNSNTSSATRGQVRTAQRYIYNSINLLLLYMTPYAINLQWHTTTRT